MFCNASGPFSSTAVSASTSVIGGIKLVELDRDKEVSRSSFGTGGWTLTLQANRCVIREDIIKHGLHDNYRFGCRHNGVSRATDPVIRGEEGFQRGPEHGANPVIVNMARVSRTLMIQTLNLGASAKATLVLALSNYNPLNCLQATRIKTLHVYKPIHLFRKKRPIAHMYITPTLALKHLQSLTDQRHPRKTCQSCIQIRHHIDSRRSWSPLAFIVSRPDGGDSLQSGVTCNRIPRLGIARVSEAGLASTTVVHGLRYNQGDVGAGIMGVLEEVVVLDADLNGPRGNHDTMTGLYENRVVKKTAGQVVLLDRHGESLHVCCGDVEVGSPFKRPWVGSTWYDTPREEGNGECIYDRGSKGSKNEQTERWSEMHHGDQ